ncbi:MAG: hypothetical protein QM831_20355 [Kofleriaceae bacterium]
MDRLHARREGSFLLLASLFMLATLALPLWFTSSYVVDISGLPFDLAGATDLTIGVLVFPIALIVGQLVCELFGARRAGMLALAGTLGSIAVIAGEYATIDNYQLPLALALVTCTTITNAANVIVFAATRRAMDGRALWLGSFLATPVALLAGWSAFTGAWVGLGGELDDAIALASAPCLYACACALAGMIPLVIARKAFGVYLRIGGREAPPIDHSLVATRRRLPPALIVDEEPRALRQPLPFTTAPFRKPFTTLETEFFAEGDSWDTI